MAKQPYNIYKELIEECELSESGYIDLRCVYRHFSFSGYGTVAANKWILNWAHNLMASVRIDPSAYLGYMCTFGNHCGQMTPEECCPGKLWFSLKKIEREE